MSEASTRRVFFALWPDDAASERLAALAHDVAAGGSRVLRPAALHLTLAFVGAVTPSQLALLEELAAGVRAEAFDLSLDHLGFWPQRGILWVGCRQPPIALQRLAESLVAALRAAGFAIDHRSGAAQVPHITLARRARCTSLPPLAAPLCWHVDEFSLVETHLHPSAASYETLAGYPLEAANAGPR